MELSNGTFRYPVLGVVARLCRGTSVGLLGELLLTIALLLLSVAINVIFDSRLVTPLGS